MKVLLLGGGGYLGPHVVAALEPNYELRISDVKEIDSLHETAVVDIANFEQVRSAADGTDVIINCSVSRDHPKGAFDVNTLGTYHAVRAAVDAGHDRFINTGPLFTVPGHFYREHEFDIIEEVPPHAGTGLYALSKSTGQEICRVFSENYPIHVLCMIVSSFPDAEPPVGQEGKDINPMAVTFRDAAQGIRCALEVDPATLPSRNELFFLTADLPHGRYSNGKARRLLDFVAQDRLEAYWRNPTSPPVHTG